MKPPRLAIIAQSLYLANLLLLPGISLLILAGYCWYYRQIFGISRLHLMRALQLSVINGLLLGIIPAIYVLLAASQSQALMLTLFYFVCVHAAFVLLGMLNLARAMSRKCPLF